MTAEAQPLLSQIDQAQDRLGGLELDLHAVDAELASFAEQRGQHRLIEDACASLERLGKVGAAGTFWGSRFDQTQADEHLRQVRARLAEFAARVRVAEDKRRSLVDGIKQGSDVLAILEGDLLEIEEEEYQKSLEWAVERD